MQFDPTAIVATDIPPTDSELLRDIKTLLVQLVDLNTPGIPGIRGAQEIPELTIERRTIRAGAPWHIQGNRRRAGLLIKNNSTSGTLYIMDDASDTTAQGFPLGVGESLVLGTRSAVWLDCASGTIDAAFCEVSS